jgi:hypothetical protein
MGCYGLSRFGEDHYPLQFVFPLNISITIIFDILPNGCLTSQTTRASSKGNHYLAESSLPFFDINDDVSPRGLGVEFQGANPLGVCPRTHSIRTRWVKGYYIHSLHRFSIWTTYSDYNFLG